MIPSDFDFDSYLREHFSRQWAEGPWDVGQLSGTPFDDSEVRREMGAPEDCRTLWQWNDDWFVLFHQTSVESMESILRDGPVPHACRTGFSGELQPEAFYVSAVPLAIPHEVWMPHLEGKELAIVGVLVPCFIAMRRFLYHPTWPVVQFALRPGDWDAVCHVPESCFRNFRTDRNQLANIDRWRQEREMEGQV